MTLLQLGFSCTSKLRGQDENHHQTCMLCVMYVNKAQWVRVIGSKRKRHGSRLKENTELVWPSPLHIVSHTIIKSLSHLSNTQHLCSCLQILYTHKHTHVQISLTQKASQQADWGGQLNHTLGLECSGPQCFKLSTVCKHTRRAGLTLLQHWCLQLFSVCVQQDGHGLSGFRFSLHG